MIDPTFYIRQLVPECADGEEMDLRKALLVARDYAAMLRSRVVTEWALTLAAEAHDLAGQFAFAHTGRRPRLVVAHQSASSMPALMGGSAPLPTHGPLSSPFTRSSFGGGAYWAAQLVAIVLAR